MAVKTEVFAAIYVFIVLLYPFLFRKSVSGKPPSSFELLKTITFKTDSSLTTVSAKRYPAANKSESEYNYEPLCRQNKSNCQGYPQGHKHGSDTDTSFSYHADTALSFFTALIHYMLRNKKVLRLCLR